MVEPLRKRRPDGSAYARRPEVEKELQDLERLTLTKVLAHARQGERQGKASVSSEECLYFVATSRARSHLRHYGSAVKPSEFIDRVHPSLRSVRSVPLAAKPAEAINDWILPIASTASGVIDADELSRYDRCPRRFLYTYLLDLSGRQRETPFVKAHDCVYATIRAAKAHGSPDKAWLLGQLDTFWKDRGPVPLRRFCLRLVTIQM